ncbi:MAG: TIGR02147 family protein [Bdellovibrionota bacterium]
MKTGESIYLAKNYRVFLKAAFAARAKNGFGEAAKLARALSVHSTFVSQVMNGLKSFSDEQALAVCGFLNLNERETEFFLDLVKLDKAGTREYKRYIETKLEHMRSEANELVNRVAHEAVLSEEHRAIFYSDWIFSAVRLTTLLPGCATSEAIAIKRNLPLAKVKKVVDFLLESGLLKRSEGRLTVGPLSTHLESKSPWIKAHHSNWRQKALDDVSFDDQTSLHYSAPMTLSRADAEKIREILISAINEIDVLTEPSRSEELMCLNIDWFKVR